MNHHVIVLRFLSDAGDGSIGEKKCPKTPDAVRNGTVRIENSIFEERT